MVYLVTCPSNNTCKIGYSTDPIKRLRSLKTSSPFELFLHSITEGETSDEKSLHLKFKEYRLKGEWFKLTSDIINHFNNDIVKVDTYIVTPKQKIDDSPYFEKIAYEIFQCVGNKNGRMVINKAMQRMFSERSNVPLTSTTRIMKHFIENSCLIEVGKYYYAVDINKFKQEFPIIKLR